ncbi:primase-helicase zinc-binding domain-containing protein [Acidithiobacillus sp.]|uniref:DUF7146 domain-containing protein n=1 Tax=Acidithiobacillus sp. TaxID=1872118 RepID=UPI003561DE51
MPTPAWMTETKWAVKDRWLDVLPRLGIDSKCLCNRHGPCPGCGGTDRFRFDPKEKGGTFYCSQGGGELLKGDGFSLLEHVHGWNFKHAMEEVARVLGTLPVDYDLAPAQRAAPAQSAKTSAKSSWSEKDQKEATERARKTVANLWRQTLPLRECPQAMAYFENRHIPFGLIADAQDLRAISDLGYWIQGKDGKPRQIGSFPALIAVCRGPNHQVLALHRTWLQPDGSGKLILPDPERPNVLLDPRKLTTPIVRKVPLHIVLRPMTTDGVLGVGEGIETALAASFLHNGVAVHATVNSGNMGGRTIDDHPDRILGGYTPPQSCSRLMVFADPDSAGLEAAGRLQRRMQLTRKEMAVEVRTPRIEGDWNDVLDLAAQQFPQRIDDRRRGMGLEPGPSLPVIVPEILRPAHPRESTHQASPATHTPGRRR